MSSFMVKTGYGYFLDSKDTVIAKSELPPGEHGIKDEYRYIEVASKEALDAVEISMPSLTKEQIREQKIQAEMRRMAEESLIKRGELEK